MKSIFLTFLIFAGVFMFAGSGVLSVIGENWFHYTSYVAFVVVMIAGIYITLLRNPAIKDDAEIGQIEKSDAQIEQEENKNDKE